MRRPPHAHGGLEDHLDRRQAPLRDGRIDEYLVDSVWDMVERADDVQVRF